MENIPAQTDRVCKPISHFKNDAFLYTGAMFRYCFKMGIALPDDLFQEFLDISGRQNGTDSGTAPPPKDGSTKDMAALSAIFNTLSAKVAPALPDTIYIIEKGMQKVNVGRHLLEFRFLGPVPIVRGLMGAALVALLMFLALALSANVNAVNMTKNLFEMSGSILASNLLFLTSAAALGAAFAALFELKAYIVNRTYDSVYETDYWIRFFLGIISGILLAELIPINLWLGASSSEVMQGAGSPVSVPLMTRPVLAMLGGFSVKAFYQILKRIVHTLETLVQGKPMDKTSSSRTELNNQLNTQNLKNKTQMFSDMGKIQQLINKGETKEIIQKEIDGIMDTMRHGS